MEEVASEPVSEPGAWNTENREQSDPALCAAPSEARPAREDKSWRRRQSRARWSRAGIEQEQGIFAVSGGFSVTGMTKYHVIPAT